MMNRKQIGFLAGFSLVLLIVGSGLGAGIYATFFAKDYSPYTEERLPTSVARYDAESFPPLAQAQSQSEEALKSAPPSFISAARVARPAVVHIKSAYKRKKSKSYGDFFSNPLDNGFGRENMEVPKAIATGSGVLISPAGFIITNNHVIDEADEIEVTLFDNQTFEATIVGTDITTDLALIKIEGKSLPYLDFTNSDAVEVGQWVMAVGNPMDLTSTVTAGIVSAKGRNINLLRADSDLAIESFIQTDAAVNKGNSGGALVNMEGKLIGINTAIASKTGYYAGYSFAIPSTIAKKVMEDLLKYGEVKRGYLGVSIQPLNSAVAEKYHLNVLKGAIVTRVNPDLGAYEAGIRDNDVIISVNEIEVNNSSELQEQVSKYHPGEYVNIKAIRDNREMTFKVLLKELNRPSRRSSFAIEEDYEEDESPSEWTFKGSTFKRLSEGEYDDLGVDVGVMVTEAGEILQEGGIRENFVITHVDGRRVRNIAELEKAFVNAKEYIAIKGQYKSGVTATYSFNW
ncbi:MAG: trypsin-like peptidase domain-containing protein [Bacteroidota bacterium]